MELLWRFSSILQKGNRAFCGGLLPEAREILEAEICTFQKSFRTDAYGRTSGG
jgi:hypothetical protein